MKLSIVNRDAKSTLAAAYEAANSGRSKEFEVVRDFLASSIYGLEFEAGVPYGRDNALLGVKMMTAGELNQAIITHLKK